MAAWRGYACGGERQVEQGRVISRASAYLNALPAAKARAELTRCCGADRWVDAMLAARPFGSDVELLALAERVWWALGRADWLWAFAAHPRTGARSTTENRKRTR